MAYQTEIVPDVGIPSRTSLSRVSLTADIILSGMSAVDSGEALMICSNLYDGFDLYNIQDRSYIRTIRREIPRSLNVMLPALFVCHNSDLDSALLLGSANGQVQILSSTGDVYHRLTHGKISYLICFFKFNVSFQATKLFKQLSVQSVD